MQYSITTEDIRNMFDEFFAEYDEVEDFAVGPIDGVVRIYLTDGVWIFAAAEEDGSGWTASVYGSTDEARRREYLAHDGDDNLPALQHFVQRYVDDI